jgi:hypothetical protein
MRKKHSTPKSPVESIPALLQEANNCLKVARRNGQSLTGGNYYARKFLELKASGVLLLKDLEQQLTGNKEARKATREITSDLNLYFKPSTSAVERTEANKQIIFLHKSAIEPALAVTPKQHTPTGELFPLEIIAGTRAYIEQIGQQANGCYEQRWFDACAVMLRRLLETLIIECFEHDNIASSIKDGNGNFLHLRDLIARFLAETRWNPSRNTKTALPKLKDIADLSAHSRRYIAKKPDIDNIQKELRVVIQELVFLAGIGKAASK